MGHCNVINSNLLSVRSIGFSFIAIVVTLNDDVGDSNFRRRLVVSSLLNISFINTFLIIKSSFVLPCLHQIVAPAIDNVIMLVVNLDLVGINVVSFNKKFTTGDDNAFNGCRRLNINLLILVIIVNFGYYHDPLLHVKKVTVKLYINCVTSLYLNVISFDDVHGLPLVAVPRPFGCNFDFDFRRFLIINAVCLLDILRTINSVATATVISHHPVRKRRCRSQLGNNILTSNLISIVTSTIKSLPLAAFTRGGKIVRVANITSHCIKQAVTMVLIVLNLFPVVNNFFAAVPSTILKNTVALVFSVVTVTKVHVVVAGNLGHQRALVITASLNLKLNISCSPRVFGVLPTSVCMLIRGPVYTNKLATVLLGVVLPNNCQRRGILPNVASTRRVSWRWEDR